MSQHSESYKVPAGYLYTKDHEWLQEKNEGGSGASFLVGITDYAAKMLHDIVYVNLPEKGKTFSKKDVFGQVESVKTVSDIYMPVSGKVVKSNERLTQEPEAVSSSPYEEGWMLEVMASNFEEERKTLLSPEEYSKYISQLQEQEH